MARMVPLVGLLLITLCGSAHAQGPEDQSTLLAGIKQAFLTGSPVPEVGTGPGRDQANALRQLVIAVQAGTDGSDGQKQKLRQDIESLSAQIGAPPQNVIDDYLARAKGHAQPGSGIVGTGGTSPGTPQGPGPGETVSMAPGTGPGSSQVGLKVGDSLTKVNSEIGVWNPHGDSLPGSAGVGNGNSGPGGQTSRMGRRPNCGPGFQSGRLSRPPWTRSRNMPKFALRVPIRCPSGIRWATEACSTTSAAMFTPGSL